MKTEIFQECERICEDAIRELEMTQLPLSSICLKAMRVARLLGNEKEYLELKNSSVYIPRLESYIEASKLRLSAAADPNISISSANPNQYVRPQSLNSAERRAVSTNIMESEEKLQTEKVKVYDYLIRRHYELKFGGAANDIFDSAREFVDSRLNSMAPEAIQKFISAYDNIGSTNPEDWANAVHSCRRILMTVADSLYPPENGKEIESNGRKIKIGTENYINRLMLFIESKNNSKTFKFLFGSSLESIGNRVDSIYDAANKGSHDEIESVDDAKRYVIHTYLLLWDILKLA